MKDQLTPSMSHLRACCVERSIELLGLRCELTQSCTGIRRARRLAGRPWFRLRRRRRQRLELNDPRRDVRSSVCREMAARTATGARCASTARKDRGRKKERRTTRRGAGSGRVQRALQQWDDEGW